MRRLLAFVLAGTFGCAGGPPITFDSASRRPLPDAHQCVADEVEAEGFTVTENRPDEGLLQAVGVYQRSDTTVFLGLEMVEQLIEWARIEALFEREGSSTRVEYTAATSEARTGPWREPSPYVTELAEDIAGTCG